MRAIPVAAAALLGACALTSCVPVAGAAGDSTVTPFGFRVLPSTIAAGGEVTLIVDRADGRCKGPATVSAPVFDPVTIPPRHTSATAVVDRDARPGSVHQVAFRCDGATGTTGLTIAGGSSPTPTPTSPPPPTTAPPPPPEHPGHGRHEHPEKGVHAGEGGTVAGFDLKNLGLGALLVAGSVGAAYHLSRRRTGEDGG
ncbi:hypothetical protein J7I94_07240 [Streptomyces sp. ISL-12]|uniref:hypothetical protein n=1 Tax=Streptomyces sp. ISL-12 TaxID=2819177 RepID=UPI001BE73CFA|nr:hypothetical protein [Streptomyces sp. ISL-12]MBT2410353.1 hypothetical protein [Streptomyces sp. ISL-12]